MVFKQAKQGCIRTFCAADRNFGGFTLIELLVVVLIIGILAAVALPQYQKAVAWSRYQNIILFGAAFARAQNMYYTANNAYASSFEDLDILPQPKSKSGSHYYFSWGDCHLRPENGNDIQCNNADTTYQLTQTPTFGVWQIYCFVKTPLGHYLCQKATDTTTYSESQWGNVYGRKVAF